MNRRQFLITSAVVFSGSLLGLHNLAPAYATVLAEHPAGPKLALVIDDIGFSRPVAQRFLDLHIPLTFSILPRLPLSTQLARSIHSQSHEIMLHQPMEPLQADIDPGPGAIYVNDSNERVARIMAENIASLPHLTGANNHMGSRFTQDRQKVHQALGVICKQGLYFIDSLTTMRSQAYRSARHLHMPTLQRDLFLDPVANAETTFRQLCRLKRRACIHGSALGIGHPYPETLLGLQRFIQCNGHKGVNLVYASRLMAT